MTACRLFVGATVVGASVATATALSTGTSMADSINWDAIAQCESNDNWAADTGNGRYGGLQMSLDDWRSYGGVGPSPATASRQDQIDVANRIAAKQGISAWGKCSSCSHEAAPTGSLTNIVGVINGKSSCKTG
ncbi:transglycosylase family protein [Mycobacterium riyadhense]|nr:transglycosylase family protein [Mycobacterium riyadhense]